MKPSAACLVVLLAVQCLTWTHADDFCDSKSTLSMIDRDDVLVTTSTWTSNVAKEFDWSQEALNGYLPEVEPFSGDHDLITGDCEHHHDLTYTIDMCIYPDPENGTGSQNTTVQFADNLSIGCIKVIDAYNNTDGEDLGGYPFLDGGGVGYDHVDLRFVSQEAEGMKFHMEISADRVDTTTPGETTPEVTTPEVTTPEVTTPEVTTTEGTTTGEPTTTTPPSGDAMSAGKFRGNLFMLCCFVLLMGRVFGQ